MYFARNSVSLFLKLSIGHVPKRSGERYELLQFEELWYQPGISHNHTDVVD
jgi:hypothetical protein